MDGGALHLPTVGGVAAPAVRVILGGNLRNIAVLVGLVAHAADQVSSLQPALGAAGIEALVLGHGLGKEVVGLHVQLPGEGDLPLPVLGTVGVVLHGEGLALPLRVVGDDQLHRAENRHPPLGGLVEVLPETVLQEAVLHGAGCLGHADALAEISDGGRGVAPSAEAAEGGHPGIVPAGDPAALHQRPELALAHDGMVDAQAGKFDLPGLTRQVAVLYHPVVQGTVGLKLQGAEAVGDALQGVLNGVGEIVHGVDAPLVPLAVVVHVVDAVDHGVPHVEVAGAGVDLGPEGHGPVGELPGPHSGEEVKTLLHRAVPVGALGGAVHVPPHLLHLLRGQLADVGQALLDEGHGALVHLLEVVGGIVEPVAPVKAQPVDVLLDGLHVLHVLLGGVGVVHAEVAQPAVLLGGAEVDAQGLAVADVQIAVGLRRETGVDGHALELTTLCDVLVDELMDKVFALGLLGQRGLVFLGHVSHSFVC